MDMAVVSKDKDRSAQQSVLTASGAYGHGSLRMVRSGIGMHSHAELELVGVKQVWSLYGSKNTNHRDSDRADRVGGKDSGNNSKGRHHRFVVLSFAAETKCLGIDEYTMEPTEIGGFEENARTLYCGDIMPMKTSVTKTSSTASYIVQVTASACHLVDPSNNCRVSTFECSDISEPFVVATGNVTQIVVSERGGRLIYLTVSESESGHCEWKVIGTLKLDSDIAALSVQAFTEGLVCIHFAQA